MAQEDSPGELTPAITRPSGARSTEHNIDFYALAMDLYGLTFDTNWLNMADHARNFVTAMYNTNGAPNGFYWIGTVYDGVTINQSPIPADAQSWSTLATVDSFDHATNALMWMDSHLDAWCWNGTNWHKGIK